MATNWYVGWDGQEYPEEVKDAPPATAYPDLTTLPIVPVAIVGSREYPRLSQVPMLVQALADLDPRRIRIRIISGGAPGVDTHAINAAMRHRLEHLAIPAKWEAFGNRAGYMRNPAIIRESQFVAAFWNGRSSGTLDSINHAKRYRRHLYIFNPGSLDRQTDALINHIRNAHSLYP